MKATRKTTIRTFSLNFFSKHQMLICYSSCCQRSNWELVWIARSSQHSCQLSFSRKRAAQKGVGFNGEQTSDHICLKTDEKWWHPHLSPGRISRWEMGYHKTENAVKCYKNDQNRRMWRLRSEAAKNNPDNNCDKQQPRSGLQNNCAMKIKCRGSLSFTSLISRYTCFKTFSTTFSSCLF